MLKTLGDKLHAAFEVSLVFKGLFAAAEIAAGIFAWLVPPQFLLGLVEIITRTELTEDPNDFIATRLLHAAQGLSIGGQHFAALYLLSHGILKLWLIIGLWRGKLAYYPVTLVVFGVFIVYQLYRYSHTHSPMLLVLTVVDVLVIWLTLTEYRRLRLAREAA
jgi:uncharacterized membrane protein